MLKRKEWKQDERGRVFKITLQVENIKKEFKGLKVVQVLKRCLNELQVLKRSGSRLGVESRLKGNSGFEGIGS